MRSVTAQSEKRTPSSASMSGAVSSFTRKSRTRSRSIFLPPTCMSAFLRSGPLRKVLMRCVGSSTGVIGSSISFPLKVATRAGNCLVSMPCSMGTLAMAIEGAPGVRVRIWRMSFTCGVAPSAAQVRISAPRRSISSRATWRRCDTTVASCVADCANTAST